MNRRLLLLWILPSLVVLYSCNPQKKMAKKQHAYMEAAYVALKDAVNEAEVTILNDTVKVLFPEHLLFQKNSSEINEATLPLMQRFAKALNQYPKTSILINGYTDVTGGEELNHKLSQNRADSARGMLKNFTVDTARMYTWGLGSANPIGDNNTEVGRRRNRRVEFIVLYSYNPKP